MEGPAGAVLSPSATSSAFGKYVKCISLVLCMTIKRFVRLQLNRYCKTGLRKITNCVPS